MNQEIITLKKRIKIPDHLEVEVPGSKSLSSRALLLAAMADGKSTLRGLGFSDDSRHFVSSLKSLGFEVQSVEEDKTVTIVGHGAKIPNKKAEIDVGSAGTAARFLTAFLAFSDGEYVVNASEQMKSRPMKPLLDALEALGTKFEFLGEEGFLPYRIIGGNIKGGEVAVNSTISSQFLSALILSGALCEEDLTIRTRGRVPATSFIGITMKMMKQWGVDVEQRGEGCFVVAGGQNCSSQDYQIEPDVSAACYFYAMTALTGGTVVVKNVHADTLQGDIQFLNILKRLGCTVKEGSSGLEVSGVETFEGIAVDMNDVSDQALTMAALAPFASSPTEIINIGHIRHHECDRISAMVTELQKMGIECEERRDGVTIHPGTPKPTVVNTYGDHRMAMAFSLVALRVPGMSYTEPSCTEKTFEGYFDLLNRINLA